MGASPFRKTYFHLVKRAIIRFTTKIPAYTRAMSRPMVSFCMATASTASMEATEPWMPSPAENQVLNGSSAPTITLEPADRIINPIMVLNVPLMHSLTGFR